MLLPGPTCRRLPSAGLRLWKPTRALGYLARQRAAIACYDGSITYEREALC